MIYIHGTDGLTQISPSLTKEKIITALGFTPADNATFYEDETGALLVVDNAGYVIARIDENGLTTTQVSASAIALNGEDLAAKLQELANKVPDIDLSNYYTKDEVDTALGNVSVNLDGYATEKYVDDAVAGIEIPEVNLDGYATEKYVDDAMAGIEIPEPDLSKYALSADVEANKVLTDAHANNEEIHVTAEKTAAWDAKSDFDGDFNSLSNAPHIVNDNEDEVVICDSQGNVILRATAEGLNVAAVYVNGKMVSFPDYSDADEGKTLKIVNGVPAWA